MKEIITEWRNYLLTEINSAEFVNKASELIKWLDAGGQIPKSITGADEKQKEMIDIAKELANSYQKYSVYLKQENKQKLIQTILGLIRASKTLTGKDADKFLSVKRDDHPISNMFIDFSRGVHKKTGIIILDPTARKNPPAWASKCPICYASLQTAADFFASDPFSAALLFVPFGKLGGAGVKALQQAGIKGAAKYAAMPLGEVVAKVAPDKAAKILQNLETTEVKAVVKDFHENLVKQKITPLDWSISYSGAPWMEDAVKAARQTIARASSGALRSNAEVVANSIKGGKVLIHYGEAGKVRPIVVLETQKGPIAFYRSTGTGTPGQKLAGEWHIYGGHAPHSSNHLFFTKNQKSVNLTNGADEYLTKLSLALEEAWTSGLIKAGTQRMKDVAQSNLKAINFKIEQMNQQAGYEKFLLYNQETLQEAYINKFLNNHGVFEGEVGQAYFSGYNNSRVGISPIRSEQITQFDVRGKILPSLDEILGL